uniref:Protein kinase domain-containing protein n=1 Tax=Panagrolaimus superbus TaxID=310955 RepID=A0A914YSQ0_9BILA
MALRRMVYMLDFGIARTYVDENGNPLPRRQGTSFRGTSRYCALPQHKESDQCRRDDEVAAADKAPQRIP